MKLSKYHRITKNDSFKLLIFSFCVFSAGLLELRALTLNPSLLSFEVGFRVIVEVSFSKKKANLRYLRQLI